LFIVFDNIIQRRIKKPVTMKTALVDFAPSSGSFSLSGRFGLAHRAEQFPQVQGTYMTSFGAACAFALRLVADETFLFAHSEIIIPPPPFLQHGIHPALSFFYVFQTGI
jgi:hypothetical protein